MLRRDASGLGALEFTRDFVAASQPVVITGLAAEEWPCLERWSEEYLLERVGDAQVSVNLTPGGWGDFVDEGGLFVKPLEESMVFRDFWRRLSPDPDAGQTGSGAAVPYLSQQNDSLRQERASLF